MRMAKIRQAERAGAPSRPRLLIDSTLPNFTAKAVTGAGKMERLQSEMARVIHTPTTPFSMLQSQHLPPKPTVDPKTPADMNRMYEVATRNVDSQATEMRYAALDNADTSSTGRLPKQLVDSLVIRTATTKVLQKRKVSTPYPTRSLSVSRDRPAPRNQPSRFDFSLFQAALNDIRKSSATSTLSSNSVANKSASSRAVTSPNEENGNVVDVESMLIAVSLRCLKTSQVH
ncbi:hypothetical protein QFC22_002302 [Naganishia vaughanmartiniae]|uniref:Uncharacterized protein n=1 Tax=Naganishia vaughanmartiniae TaxID=1424756 RepID=A0ACC2XG38_9TREE|nr:hypothetical protein QFC22_002302 [Naganishia vaughanmartiniae]